MPAAPLREVRRSIPVHWHIICPGRIAAAYTGRGAVMVLRPTFCPRPGGRPQGLPSSCGHRGGSPIAVKCTSKRWRRRRVRTRGGQAVAHIVVRTLLRHAWHHGQHWLRRHLDRWGSSKRPAGWGAMRGCDDAGMRELNQLIDVEEPAWPELRDSRRWVSTCRGAASRYRRGQDIASSAAGDGQVVSGCSGAALRRSRGGQRVGAGLR